jgi:hypothetical protein
MKAYRYNTLKREHRRFNTCGAEKNPLGVKFYASNMDYADNYKYVYNSDGELNYECELEVVEIPNVPLFDMDMHFRLLETYKNYVNELIGRQVAHYTKMANKSKLVRERKMWLNFISDLTENENDIIASLRDQEFQHLSDFSNQLQLVAELKALGFHGYTTKNEIAIF